MPIYEYKCTACADRFEVEQRITDDALTTLEGCTVSDDGEHTLKKVFSSIGISFKGDGFYRNDARGSKSKTRSSPDAGSTPAGSTPSTDSGSSSGSTTSDKSTPAPATPSPTTSSAAD